jgi:hypothetical protein
MCDIYGAKCAECDTKINMHLGDYNTGRHEIVVLCHEHAHLYEKYGTRVVFWQHNEARQLFHKIKYKPKESNAFASDEPLVAVVALTDNAWENKMHNCPNSGICAPIPNLEMYDNYMEVWERAIYGEHSDWNPDGIGTRLIVARDSAIKVYTDWWDEVTKGWPNYLSLYHTIKK